MSTAAAAPYWLLAAAVALTVAATITGCWWSPRRRPLRVAVLGCVLPMTAAWGLLVAVLLLTPA